MLDLLVKMNELPEPGNSGFHREPMKDSLSDSSANNSPPGSPNLLGDACKLTSGGECGVCGKAVRNTRLPKEHQNQAHPLCSRCDEVLSKSQVLSKPQAQTSKTKASSSSSLKGVSKKAGAKVPKPTPKPTKNRQPKEKVFRVNTILDSRTKKGVKQYLVRWDGFGPGHDSWEPLESFEPSRARHSTIVAFEAFRTTRLPVDELRLGPHRVSRACRRTPVVLVRGPGSFTVATQSSSSLYGLVIEFDNICGLAIAPELDEGKRRVIFELERPATLLSRRDDADDTFYAASREFAQLIVVGPGAQLDAVIEALSARDERFRAMVAASASCGMVSPSMPFAYPRFAPAPPPLSRVVPR